MQTGTGHISLGTYSNRQNNQQKEQENSVKTTDDALTCLELECNQTFLGMVQLQYQPWVDMVQLIGKLYIFFRSTNFFPSNRFQCKGAIFQLNYFYFPSGLLEKACIRFVHFSKENELHISSDLTLDVQTPCSCLEYTARDESLVILRL